MKKVAIIMGSDSDLPVLKPAVKMLAELEIPFDVRVMSAHRTPAEAADFARNARALSLIHIFNRLGGNGGELHRNTGEEVGAVLKPRLDGEQAAG